MTWGKHGMTEELDMIKTWNKCITRHGVDNMKEEHDLGKAWDDT